MATRKVAIKGDHVLKKGWHTVDMRATKTEAHYRDKVEGRVDRNKALAEAEALFQGGREDGVCNT